MPVVWSPRIARLKRNAAAGATTIRTFESALDGESSFRARLGTEIVTMSGRVGDTWNVSPALVTAKRAEGLAVEVCTLIAVGGGNGHGLVDHTGVGINLRTREACPEGEIEATWDVVTRTPAVYTPNLDAPAPCPFLLWENSSGTFLPFFGGFMGRVEDAQRRNGFHRLTLTGRGGYITLSWRPVEVSHIYAASTAGHSMIQEALGVWDPYISPSTEHMIDGGLQIGQEYESVGRTVRQMIDFVTAKGESDNVPIDWMVRTELDGSQKLWIIKRTRQPTIEIPLSSLQAPAAFVKDYEHVKNKVTVKYRDGYVSEPTTAVVGAIRGIYRDYSTQIDNEDLARQVALAILANTTVIEAISSGQVVVEHPKPIYKNGVPFPLHLVKAGWLATFTGWTGGFPLETAQIKGIDADHRRHKLSLNAGKLLEDDLAVQEAFFGKQTTILGTPASALVPLAIAPPEGTSQQVQSNAASLGANGQFGWRSVGPDSDIEQWTYNLFEGGEVITPGRKSPPDPMQINGRIIGFRLSGSVGETTDTGSITIDVYRSHAADFPALGTLMTTIAITSAVKGSTDLSEPPGVAPDVIFDVIGGDFLIYVVKDDPAPDAFTHVGITPLLQRTGGSGRAVAGGAAAILGASVARDADTGFVTFTVTTDRPCTVQIEYGETTNYMSKTAPTEIVKTVSHIPHPNIKSPFHYRAIAKDKEGHTTVGLDQTG